VFVEFHEKLHAALELLLLRTFLNTVISKYQKRSINSSHTLNCVKFLTEVICGISPFCVDNFELHCHESFKCHISETFCITV
jgi:hypothetical protein